MDIIAERTTGIRVVTGTDFEIRDLVHRDQRPGRRPTWIVLLGLCNGTALVGREFASRKAALAFFAERA